MSGRSRLKMRNISAVHRPMPRTCTRSAITSSSLISSQRYGCTSPSAKRRARSTMYSVLRSESPQARSSVGFLSRIPSGVTAPAQATTRSHTLCAAFTEICWPTIARASVRNGSPRLIRWMPLWVFMIEDITGSLRASARFARSQYSGFMDREIGEQVLRLHLDHALVGGEREIDGASPDVGAHRALLLELEREEREDVAHPSLLDLASRPQLVQDRRRFRVEAHVPCPARFFDLADRLHPHPGLQKMKNPGLDHPAQSIQSGTTVGNTDHRVVARFALPVKRGVVAIEHVEIGAGELALRLDDEAADGAVAVAARMHLDGLEIGEQHMAVLDGRFLFAEEKLAGPQPERVVGAVQDIAQDHVHQLVDEHRRDLDRRAEQRHVAAFDRARVEQLLPEVEHDAVVVARVRIFDRGKVDAAARFLHQRRVQRALAFAGLFHRVDFRAQVVRAQEIVGDPQAA